MALPTPAKLGLTSPRAAQDIEELSLDDAALLWTLAGTGDPDLALNTAHRFAGALPAEWDEVRSALAADPEFCTRFFALLGGSTALSDHLVANPHLWRELAAPLPSEEEMREAMLRAVEAEHIEESTYRASARFSDKHAAKDALRETYRTLMMRIAAADLAGTFTPLKGHGGATPVGYQRTTALLTALADAALTAALAVAIRQVYGDEEPDTALAVVAMGKCGARELNYISDVDVIFVAEEATAKATHTASEFMQLGTACFFEVDANLRPEGKAGALVRTLDSHVTYYKRWAETWEFQALLKARPLTGAVSLGKRYVEKLAPLVWEASQRESFVEDVQAMRRRVLANVPESLRQRELKLGEGGLRDVEFAVQLLQLVHGRIDESLREPNTVEALNSLMVGGYVGREDTDKLIRAYEFLRLLEHRLQLQRFKRTHQLPADDDEKRLRWLARTAGFQATARHTAVEEMQRALTQLRRVVANLHERLFYRPLLEAVVDLSIGEATFSADAVKAQLAALGYRHPARAYDHLNALVKGTSRKAKLQAILLPTLMHWLADTADPGAGLLNYRKLSDAALDRSWFLRMLRDEGVVGMRLMHILGNSPYTSDLIISAPDVVKLLGDGSSGTRLLEPAPDQVHKAIINSANRHRENPDKAVAVARSLRRAELARIASADLLGMMDVRQVCTELTIVWEAVLQAALESEIHADLLAQGLAEQPARIAFIGMGRLGGAELGYGSDADVMVVAEPVGETSESDATAWAARIVDQLRKRLAKPSDDPPLEVDLGLRPEGRSGAVARTIASYERYYSQWGEVWEKQALQRATVVAGHAETGEAFLRMIDQFRYPSGGASRADIREIRRIKARVDNERLPRGADRATHTKLGRGALADVEWTVQLLTMMHAHKHEGLHTTSTLDALDFLAELDDPAVLPAEQAEILRTAWLMATRARSALVLVSGKRTDQLPAPGPQLAQVAGSAGYDPDQQQQFLEDYLRITRRAHQVIEEVFWGEKPTREFD
ncbi:bifunctional [glutamine synthetase] adenylyltransferase/[glutamine synthetase]-adenylyl-L-tyrosine phosphorylase [Corynebacterium imitans]|uniref:bifunctional [glutamine synthetase] adenylyltransferase/[glutamine synthetase]-adenylyl-L-tyrosine phosphorylase n=1 Tax=Corynebacterium imitans TaxID=156978 RepID=UPI002549E512|nr:bifunctional [glutamine synthetase] adenylyltransferase/[glutamine synthetase]-adenylyl-L-tyrosine phosphorylase [Corynebacterium imitans]MDK8305819.1 bifunctional [glutamine synthetase] adenylyltransferase/[glutamine synthetase]-adenylyl-L-tyrosine phosphorylase [Corynebacterium imitans]MDK8636715.1 bifunctional [glutamine synthetase] adenylyltransferase/[glutamine synthetase]-adenylyl-L-tyrosine phosphorylase [Corynebacterium imitans]MDK8772330.1 bifunctional [glutamine synthetase] adenylyl